MPLFEALLLALQTLRAQKLKSAFAFIGVFIGVMFLIAAWSIVNGMNVYMTEKFAGTIIGVNTFHLRRRPDFTPNVSDSLWRAWARRPRITFTDAREVAAGITTPVITAWESSATRDIEGRTKVVRDAQITGATERYFEIKNLRIAQGRAFTAQEVRSGAPVVVIGYDVVDRLFPDRDPIDKTVRIGGRPYRVIGVTERQGKLFGFSLDRFAVAPALSPIQHLVNPPGIVDALIVKAPTMAAMREAMSEAEGVMRSRRHLRPRQDNNFVLETAEGVLEFWAGIQRFLFIVGPGIVLISLVVGGIVIANIMLVSVIERTREIGIRRALGARKRDILLQFLTEAVLLSLAGGLVGVLVGFGIAKGLSTAFPLPTRVTPGLIFAGLLMSVLTGLVAGVFPARKAAQLPPIEALRYE